MDAYERLANAIILQAVDDWRDAAKALTRSPMKDNAKKMLEECEVFFRSNWFGVLTSLDGDYLLERLKREVQK